MSFTKFPIYLLITRFNKLETRQILLTAKKIWRKKFLNIVTVFLLEKHVIIQLKKSEPPSSEDVLCQVRFNSTAQGFLRRRKCQKLLTDGHTDARMDDVQHAIRKAFISCELNNESFFYHWWNSPHYNLNKGIYSTGHELSLELFPTPLGNILVYWLLRH